MLRLLIAAAVCLLAVQQAAGKSLVFQEDTFPSWRLPVNVRPTKYDLHLSFPSLDTDVYEGQVNISVDFLGDGLELSRMKLTPKYADLVKGIEALDSDVMGRSDNIKLHAATNLDIQEIRVRSEAHLGFLYGGRLKEREILRQWRDTPKQMIGIDLKRGIRADTSGLISISFKGKMRSDMRGVYVSTYNNGGQVYKHIVSQFQPTDARTVFPCFDEPRFKVPFSIRVSHGSELVAYGNTEVKSTAKNPGSLLVTTTFETTPNMPIHMVAFTIGHFDVPLEVDSVYVKKNGERSVRKIRVITEPGKRETGRFALQVAKDALEYFEKYIDYEFPLNKLDVIAIADHDQDNTEHWGLVFVRDTIVWIDDETRQDTRIVTAVNVAHVVVHQWFANLVSAAWWSDVAVTEQIAVQFAYNIVAQLYPFQAEYFVRLGALTNVLQMDQKSTYNSLSPPVQNFHTSEQIYRLFTVLGFMKSGALGQMVSDAVGATRYQRILRAFVAKHAYKTVSFADYRAIIESSGNDQSIEDAIRVLKTFITYEGVPLVNVDFDSEAGLMLTDMERMSEARTSIEDAVKPQMQSADVCTNRAFVDGETGQSLVQGFLVNSDSKTIAAYGNGLPSWLKIASNSPQFIKISLNPTFATYYRTRYSDELLNRLKVGIKNKWMSSMDRLQILDDYNVLVQAHLIKNDTFKGLLESYTNEDDAAVLVELLVASKTLASLVTTDTTPTTIGGTILNVFEKYGFTASDEDTVIRQRARRLILKALITAGNQQVIKAALEAYEQANGQVETFLREPVYTAIVVSNSKSELVEQLLDKLARTKSYEEQIRLVTALTLSRDKTVLTRVQTWLQTSGLKAATIKPFLDAISAALAH